MNAHLFRHNETREYIYPTSRKSVLIKLESYIENLVEINLIYWKRFNAENKKKAKLESHKQNQQSHYYTYELKFKEPVRYLNYCFEIITKTEKSYLTPNGLSEVHQGEYFEYQSTNEFDIFHIPSWAEGKIGYHIFPDRFHIGNESNRAIQNWEEKPDRVKTFGGDLKGIKDKLPYLVDLGINIIFLTPIFTSHSNHKYDTINYLEIDPSFGTLSEFKDLIDEAHQKGIKIVLDGVFNHIGYYSEQFQDVIALGKKSKYWNWFYIHGDHVDVENINYECVGDYKWMPKLRYSDPTLRNFMLSIGTYWIKEAGIDGWRLDVADEVDYTFWEAFRKETKLQNNEILLTGETWHDGRDLLRGDQMDSVMNYLLRSYVIDYFIRKSITQSEFEERIERLLFTYPIQTQKILYNLLGSHDTQRILTVCQNDVSLLKMAVAFQMTYPGMPIIYYGDEIGTEGETDPDCRTTMKWNAINQDILGFYQNMTRIRNQHKSLQLGGFKHLILDEPIYGFIRTHDDESIIMLFNTQHHGINVHFNLSTVEPNIKTPSEDTKIKLHVESGSFRMIKIEKTDLETRIEFLV